MFPTSTYFKYLFQEIILSPITNICLECEDFAHSRTILQVYFWYCNGNSLTNELFTLVTNEVEIGKKKKT